MHATIRPTTPRQSGRAPATGPTVAGSASPPTSIASAGPTAPTAPTDVTDATAVTACAASIACAAPTACAASTTRPTAAGWQAAAWGLLGTAVFSLTLPMTRLAVAGLDAGLVGLGRAAVAGLLAALLLRRLRPPWPQRAQWRLLACVSGGVVLGFPVLSTIAMRQVPASHGAVIIGLLPLGTALCATWMSRERPSAAFWACAAAGSALVAAFALRDGVGAIGPGHAAMLAAVVAGALGYAAGGQLARTIGGVQVICWALVATLPLTLPLTLWRAVDHGLAASPQAWAGFAYVAVMSQLVGFFFWYRGLAIGGTARIGQIQLLQPFLTVLAASWIVAEPLDAATVAFALAVVATVALSRRAAVRSARP